jgi:hypothetical protein
VPRWAQYVCAQHRSSLKSIVDYGVSRGSNPFADGPFRRPVVLRLCYAEPLDSIVSALEPRLIKAEISEPASQYRRYAHTALYRKQVTS